MKTQIEYLVQFISSLSMLSLFTYVPYWGYLLGFSNLEITLIAIYYGITILITNLIVGRLSDLVGVRKPFILIGLIITGFSIPFLGLQTNFVIFSGIRIITAIGYGIYLPTLIALVTDKKMKLGKFSGYGTAAWAVGVVISGIIGVFWVPGLFIFSGIVVLGSFIIAITIKEEKSFNKKYEFSTLVVYMKRKRIFTAFIIRHSLASAIWALWPIYLASLGANEFSVALIQVLNPVTSSLIMNKFTDLLDSKLMVNLGLLISGITFFGYLLADNWIFILPVQILLGFSWAFIFVGVLRYGIESSEFDRSTVSGLVNSIQSISVILGSFLAFVIVYFNGSIADIILFACLGSLITFVVNYALDIKMHSSRVLVSKTL